MVLKPTLSLTLPSLKDETVLDCRVYFPTTLYDGAASTESFLGSSTGDDETQRRGNGARGGLNGDAHAWDKPRWPAKRKKAAIIAHPYAPLGGSCDDYVVQETAGILLKQGFVVGLFNFRYDDDEALDHTFGETLTLIVVRLRRKARRRGMRSQKYAITTQWSGSWRSLCSISTWNPHL